MNNPENIQKINKLNDQLNAFCIVEPLKLYAFENGHSDAINKLWRKVLDQISKNSDDDEN